MCSPSINMQSNLTLLPFANAIAIVARSSLERAGSDLAQFWFVAPQPGNHCDAINGAWHLEFNAGEFIFLHPSVMYFSWCV